MVDFYIKKKTFARTFQAFFYCSPILMERMTLFFCRRGQTNCIVSRNWARLIKATASSNIETALKKCFMTEGGIKRPRNKKKCRHGWRWRGWIVKCKRSSGVAYLNCESVLIASWYEECGNLCLSSHYFALITLTVRCSVALPLHTDLDYFAENCAFDCQFWT